jgi:hypothetical protein
MAKPSKAEKQVRALCVELARATGGRPVQWRMLHEIEERLGFDEKATAAALLAAIERNWIQVDQLAEKGEIELGVGLDQAPYLSARAGHGQAHGNFANNLVTFITPCPGVAAHCEEAHENQCDPRHATLPRITAMSYYDRLSADSPFGAHSKARTAGGDEYLSS